MCRYAMYHPYKQHYACFPCRKGFKWPQDAHHAPPREQVGEVKCPQCGEPMANMGLDFKPPRQRNVRQWRKVEVLFQHGYTYHSCGCGGPGYRPRTLSELPGFLGHPRPRSDGEALLRNTLAREASPQRWKRERSQSKNSNWLGDSWPRRSALQKVPAR